MASDNSRFADKALENLARMADGPKYVRLITEEPVTDDPQARQRASEARWSATPDTLIMNGAETSIIKPPPPSIVIVAEDGTHLLRISQTEDGMLDVTGAEERWTEGAARFVAEMRRLIAERTG